MPSDEKELALSFLDQQSHLRVYGRYYIVFSFPDVKRAEIAINTLRTGFVQVLKQFPYLAGTVRMPYIASDRLQVLYPDPVDPEAEASRIVTASMNHASNADYSYAKLKKSHFSPEKLPAKDFCPALIKNHPGLDDDDPFAEKKTSLTRGPLPVFAAQATFIPGGLILSVWFYHAITDGAGNARIQAVWSAAVRSLSQRTQKVRPYNTALQPVTEGDETGLDNARSELAALAYPLDDEPDFAETEEAFHYSKHPLRESPYKVITKLFRFPDSVVSGLVDAVSEFQKTRVTRFSALAAIIWANIIQARLPLLIASGSIRSTLAAVVDLRQHLRAPFSSPDYLGNLVLTQMPTWNLLEEGDCMTLRIVKPEDLPQEDSTSGAQPSTVKIARLKINFSTLSCFAVDVYDAVHSIDEDWIGEQFQDILFDPAHSDFSSLALSNGPDLYITDWQHMGADREWCIPGSADRTPIAIRRAAWVSEGGIVVLPRKENRPGQDPAPYEVLISLAEDDMKAFEDNLEEGNFLVDPNCDA